MNLHRLLLERQRTDKPIGVGLIGAGKFGSMYLSQLRSTPGVHLAGVADFNVPRAQQALRNTGWSDEQVAQARFVESALDLITADDVEVIIDATGSPAAGVDHVLLCCREGKHVVMVNVEADALCGPALAAHARAAGIVYSLAYGDQPALICELVDWARTAGFEVVAAGKGTKYLPAYHASTPATVWQHYGITPENARQGGMNAQMFNSFLDGTKSAIEMCAVANATGLIPADGGLSFPPCGVDDLPHVLRPAGEGGMLQHRGQVEVISSVERDGRPVFRDLRWGVYVVLAGDHVYVQRCFKEYGLVTDTSGTYTAMYKPYHLIGLELGISVASVALRREPTGAPLTFFGERAWHADVVATAKRDLKAGETLDGEGGYTVFGKLMRAQQSLATSGLPLGLAHGLKLLRDVPCGATLSMDDVEAMPASAALQMRDELAALL
jgi:predicted homoserine dehydrogenase-like protein